MGQGYTPGEARPRAETHAADAWNNGDIGDTLDVILIGTYQSTADAQIAKTILDGLGIDSMFNQDTLNGGGPRRAAGSTRSRA
jgi:hypothetical protein